MRWIILCWDVLIKVRMICMVVSRNSNSSGRYSCESLKKLLPKLQDELHSAICLAHQKQHATLLLLSVKNLPLKAFQHGDVNVDLDRRRISNRFLFPTRHIPPHKYTDASHPSNPCASSSLNVLLRPETR